MAQTKKLLTKGGHNVIRKGKVPPNRCPLNTVDGSDDSRG